MPAHFEAFERFPIHTVQVRGELQAYLDIGKGRPVIFIHGFGGSMWQWEHQQRALSSEFRLLTPDLIGSGLSGKPDIEYRPDEMLEYFVAFMDALNIPRAALVGNSMGAGLAIGMALGKRSIGGVSWARSGTPSAGPSSRASREPVSVIGAIVHWVSNTCRPPIRL